MVTSKTFKTRRWPSHIAFCTINILALQLGLWVSGDESAAVAQAIPLPVLVDECQIPDSPGDVDVDAVIMLVTSTRCATGSAI